MPSKFHFKHTNVLVWISKIKFGFAWCRCKKSLQYPFPDVVKLRKCLFNKITNICRNDHLAIDSKNVMNYKSRHDRPWISYSFLETSTKESDDTGNCATKRKGRHTRKVLFQARKVNQATCVKMNIHHFNHWFGCTTDDKLLIYTHHQGKARNISNEQTFIFMTPIIDAFNIKQSRVVIMIDKRKMHLSPEWIFKRNHRIPYCAEGSDGITM